jgi:uncharacterized protein
MDILDSFYDLDFSKIDFKERKKSINYKYTIIQGSSQSGKSYLVYDYLAKFNSEEYLYIDFNNLKINNLNFYQDVENFININDIKILALDNFDFTLKIPKCNSIIITTTNIDNKLDNFKNLFLSPVDFEEFLLFDKHQNITTSFNYFLKYGNFIDTILIDEKHKSINIQNHIKLLSKDEIDLYILKFLIKNSGEIKSINQLYLALKREIKISKDRFYNYTKFLENNNILTFLPKYKHIKAAKKIYTYNHGLIAEVSFKKNFNNIFTNMIYLELKNKFNEIYYDDYIDFYIPMENKIILSKPFFIGLQISSKIISFIEENNIKKITIITVNNDNNIYLDNIECTVTPFYMWAAE